MSTQGKQDFEVLVIGAGPSGIGAAIQLMDNGFRDFAILEKGGEVGGTWRDNTYPGCACDVPSALYSYSFAPNPRWSRAFAEQGEIKGYIASTARERGIEPFIRFDTDVVDAAWDERSSRWQVQTSKGRYSARFLIGATGPWHRARMPEVEGLGRFEGVSFHSSRWNHDVDLAGRRVAVIGTGASAVQFIPHIQPKVAELHVFQRTPTWVLPKPDHVVPAVEKALFERLPILQQALRAAEFGLIDMFHVGFRRPAILRALQSIGLLQLRRQVPDVELRRLLTPNFTLGCKRILLSNTYYPAMTRENVRLHPLAVRAIHPRSIEDVRGRRVDVDTIVFGTGFHITDPPIAGLVRGEHGKTLADVWNGSPEAYRGTTVSGFPNFFIVLGPNLGTGHSSAFSIMEAQIGYIMGALKQARAEAWSRLDVRADAQADYNAKIQSGLVGTVYNAGGCDSYYIDRNGRNSFAWPWSTVRMMRSLRAFDAASYTIEKPAGAAVGANAALGDVVLVTGAARGIGLATAKAFHARGFRVGLGDIDEAEVQRVAAALGPRVFGARLDVTSRPSFEAFVREAEERFGPVDVLVNNAGVMPLGAFVDESDSVSRTTLDVNVVGVLLGMRLVIPRMARRGRGHVVNIASMAGKFPMPGAAVYVASKFAVVGLGASVRQEIEGTGVTLSTILPSAVRTSLIAGVPLGKGLPLVEPEEIAEAVVRSYRTRKPEIPVPAWMAGYDALVAVTPASAVRSILRVLDSKRVLTSLDTEARAAYDDRVDAQARRRAGATLLEEHAPTS